MSRGICNCVGTCTSTDVSKGVITSISNVSFILKMGAINLPKRQYLYTRLHDVIFFPSEVLQPIAAHGLLILEVSTSHRATHLIR